MPNSSPDGVRGREFYPLEQARSTDLPHKGVIVCGFPYDLVLPLRTGRNATFSRALFATVTMTRRQANFDPTRDLLLTYKDKKQEIEAGGMSGGGVWIPPRFGRGTLWNPGDHILLGPQVSWFSKRAARPLVATRIERVKRLLGI